MVGFNYYTWLMCVYEEDVKNLKYMKIYCENQKGVKILGCNGLNTNKY